MIISKQNFIDFSTDASNKLNKICSPLRKLNVQFFSYSQLSLDAKLVYLCTDTNYIRIKIEQELFDGYQFTEHLIRQGLKKYLFCGEQTKPINEVQRYLYDHGIWNSIDYYKQHEGFTEVFHFGGSKMKPELINFYLNNDKLFKRFMTYFQNTFGNILYKEKKQIQLPPKLIIPEEDSVILKKSQLEEFEQATSFSNVYIENRKDMVKITKREWECLHWLARGYHAKDIAIALDIHHRTVEHHIYVVKQKLHINSRKDWLKILDQLSG